MAAITFGDTKAMETPREGVLLPPLEDRVYDANLLVEFTCAICLRLISDPRCCAHGHNICLGCFQALARHSSRRPECPTCRDPMDKDKPNRNLTLENLLSRLDIYCRVRPFAAHLILLTLTHLFALILPTQTPPLKRERSGIVFFLWLEIKKDRPGTPLGPLLKI